MSVPMPPDGLPYLQWAIYRDADGQMIMMVRGQQTSLEAASAMLQPGYSAVIVPEETNFETARRYGFIDIDDPAKSVVYDADKLRADGLTLADVLAGKFDLPLGAAAWDTWPIKKPTKAT